MCSCFIFCFGPERRVRRGLRFRPPPAAEQGRNLRRSGRRLARRPCRRRQSRAPQEGLPSKFKSLFLRQIKQLYFVQLLYFLLWVRAPVSARAEISTAACGGAREKSQAQRSATGKAATPPQTEPGTDCCSRYRIPVARSKAPIESGTETCADPPPGRHRIVRSLYKLHLH